MYNLGDQFKFDYERSKAKADNIRKGRKYRITVLTERLVRLEYNEDGVFEDRPTELVWNRDFNTTSYVVKEDNIYLEIMTKYFKLTYTKEKPFYSGKINTSSNLKIELLNTERSWYYGHPEARNYMAPALELSNSLKDFTKGLYSIDGFSSIDESNSKVLDPFGIITEREFKGTDVYVFMYNQDFNLALKDYFYLTGTPALIPRFALGNWWSRNNTYNDESIKDLVKSFDINDIPVSVLLLDKDWHKRTYDKKKIHLKTGFTWNNELFVNPTSLSNFLHSKGIRLGLSINPSEGIYPIEENYSKMKEYLEVDANGVVPFNVFNPRFVDAYLKLLIHPLDNLGADFFWIDYFDKNKLEELWLLKHYHFYDMMRDYRKRPMILGYNSTIAPHRYPVLYSGKTIVSWETLKQVPFFNASAANNGVSWWSHDIGGYFKGIEDSELYTRFVQLGCFSPILKFGSDAGKYYKREPWRWDFKTYEITKDYLNRRHRLIPYLYTEAYRYHREGAPLVQPIYYRYPELYDDNLYKNEYFFGSQLFVAPIVTKKDVVMNRVIHRTFIPDGTWYDIFTGKKFPGGKNYVAFFKDQEYPVFAKAGAIIPMGENDNINDTTPPKNMEIQIFPGSSNLYHLYEDDGISGLYNQGYYLLTSINFTYEPDHYTVLIKAIEGKSGIVPDKRNYKLRFRNTGMIASIQAKFNGGDIPFTGYIDGSDFIIEMNDVPTIGDLALDCKGNGLEITAVQIINEDIETIISDLQIETEMKEKIDNILFGELPLKKKRIEIRRLGKKGLEQKYITLFLKLLEYVGQL